MYWNVFVFYIIVNNYSIILFKYNNLKIDFKTIEIISTWKNVQITVKISLNIKKTNIINLLNNLHQYFTVIGKIYN